MTLYEAAQAYEDLQVLMEISLPYPKVRTLLRIRDALKTDWELYQLEYQKLLKRYASKDELGNILTEGNQVLFPGEEAENACKEAVLDLRNAPAGFAPGERLKLTASELGNQYITGRICDSLSPLVDFGGE